MNTIIIIGYTICAKYGDLFFEVSSREIDFNRDTFFKILINTG